MAKKRRGRPRQNLNRLTGPLITVAGQGLRETVNHLVKLNAETNSPVPLRRSTRTKKEMDRFGDPVDHTKKKK